MVRNNCALYMLLNIADPDKLHWGWLPVLEKNMLLPTAE